MLCDDGIAIGEDKVGKISEAQFMKYMSLRLPIHIKHIYDRLPQETQQNMEKTKTAILEALDMDPSEYLTQFNETSIKANESYTAYAYRIIRLYLQGHKLKQDTELQSRDNETIVQQFLSGINQSDANTLRLVADATEMNDITKLAKRAQKLRRHKGKTQPPLISDGQEIQTMSSEIKDDSKVYDLVTKQLSNFQISKTNNIQGKPNNDNVIKGFQKNGGQKRANQLE